MPPTTCAKPNRALSRAVHRHGYELAPTAAELRRRRHEVTDLLTHLHNAGLPGCGRATRTG